MTLLGTIRNCPALVRSLVARQVISCTWPSRSPICNPVADAEGLLDLDGEAGEEVAERVLQREAHDHGADGGGGQQLLAQQHRADHDEEADDDDVLDDRGEAIGRPVLAPRVGEQRDRSALTIARTSVSRASAETSARRRPAPGRRANLEAERSRGAARREHQPAADEAAADGRPAARA